MRKIIAWIYVGLASIVFIPMMVIASVIGYILETISDATSYNPTALGPDD